MYDPHTTKLTAQQRAAAVQRFARKHGFSASVVRACTSLLRSAIVEYRLAENRRLACNGREDCEYQATARTF